jgi:Xaa-Pro aminopeptidase
MINYKQRRQKVFSKLADNSLVLISSGEEQIRNGDVEHYFRANSDFFYLTGFSEPEAILVLIKKLDKQQAVIFVLPKDKQQEVWQGRRLGVDLAVEKLGMSKAFSSMDFAQKMPKLIVDIENIYCSFLQLTKWAGYVDNWVNSQKTKARQGATAASKLVDIDNILHETRLIKTAAEIKTMKKVAQISVRGHLAALKVANKCEYEFQIQAELEANFKKLGSPRVAFNSIVASGANACILHYTQNNAKLAKNSLVLIDAGAEYQGYAGDITTTFPLNGKFSSPQKELYDLVLKAQQAVISMIRPKIEYNELHICAEQIITKGLIELGILTGDFAQLLRQKAYKKFFMHGTSHWLGMDVHDVGAYKVNKKWQKLQAGMVLTVEPGIYISAQVGAEQAIDKKYWDIGIRIEDDILVTADGGEVLTLGLPRTTKEIEEFMKCS